MLLSLNFCGLSIFNMSDLKIVFVTNNYTPYSGGVVSSIKAFADGLRHLGHSVYIVTLDFKNAPIEDCVIRLYCPLKFTYKNNPMAVPWHMKHTLERLFDTLKPDIVHVHHPFLLGLAAQEVCRKLSIPLIFTHHTQYDQYLHYIPISPFLTRPIVHKIVTSYCNYCDLVIAPSNTIKQYLKNCSIKAPLAVIPSPLLSIFAENMPQFELKKPSLTFTLLYVGRFTQEKNVTFLIDVMKKLGSNFRLQLVGYGYYQDELENYAYNNLKLTKKQVEFIHKPSKKQIAQLYRQADFFIFASTSETQGLVLVEAMAAGTPVIALNGPGQNDLIKDGENGFLVGNKEQMKDLISSVAQDHDLFAKLQYGAWLSAQHFTIKILTKKLLYYYCNLLTKKDEASKELLNLL